MEMVDSGCRGEQMERKGGGDLRTRACARSRVGMYTHTRICTHARMHTISHMCGEIQVYAENSSRGNGLVARPSHAPGLAAYTHTKREKGRVGIVAAAAALAVVVVVPGPWHSVLDVAIAESGQSMHSILV